MSVALFQSSVKKEEKKRRWTGKGRGGGALWRRSTGLSQWEFLESGGCAEKMVRPRAVIHGKGIPLSVCVCVDVYNDVIPLVPGLSGTDSRAGARGGAAFWFESDGLLWRRRSCSLNDRCHAGYCAHGKWIPGIVDCLCTVWQENGTEAE